MNPISSEKRSRPGLLVVLVVVAVLLITVWFREGDRGPLHRVQALTHVATAPLAAAGEFVTTPLRATTTWLAGFGATRSDVAQLRKQNAELRQRNAELEEARQENERLHALVGLVRARELKAQGARVIERPINAYERVMTIDVGTRDGVAVNMPVLAAGGVLGQTIEVARDSAKVRLLEDQRSGVAAMLQRSRAEGVVRGSIDGKLSLDFISKDTTIAAGDVVITSGLGGVYPKGLVIGEVSEVVKRPADLYPTITVAPAVESARLEEVIVLVGSTPKVDTGDGE